MKYTLLLIILYSLTILSQDNIVISNESSSEKSPGLNGISPFGRSDTTVSPGKNKIISDEENSEPMLIGYCTREVFSDSAFARWFNSEYENYKPDSSAIEILKEKMKDVEITLVFGSWCDDSRIYVPHFYRILDEIKYPAEEMTLIAVNRDKKTEGDEIKGLAIDLVPTIIFYLPIGKAGRNNSELGRIVESPNQNLEEDVLNILTVSE